jgi:hypothetical protein
MSRGNIGVSIAAEFGELSEAWGTDDFSTQLAGAIGSIAGGLAFGAMVAGIGLAGGWAMV